jgi:lipopolysaccharide export system permease protein
LLELIGPWVFGSAMFTVLIIGAEYLFKVTQYVVRGAPMGMIAELSLLIVPGVLVKTFAMATLLSGLLAFGRLSGDSEIVALRAAGASIYRIVAPVAVFSIVVAVVAFVVDETVVPFAARRGDALIAAIEKRLDPNKMTPNSQGIPDAKGNLVGLISWRDFDQADGILRDATITYYGKGDAPQALLYANRLKFSKDIGLDHGWSVQGGGFFMTGDGRNYIALKDNAWPPGVQRLPLTTEDIIASLTKNNDVLSMAQIGAQIEAMRHDPKHLPSQLANLEYGYWNKVALPLAAVIYGLLGAPLGIRTGRQSSAAGFALAVAIIFAYVTLANFLNVYATGGLLPPVVASFTPLVIGLIASIVIMWRRNH